MEKHDRKSLSPERCAERRARDEGRLPKPRSKDTPSTCPDCGSTCIVRIAYGLPSPMMIEALKAGRVVLGGCLVGDDDPLWECGDCGEQVWGARNPKWLALFRGF